MATVLDKRQAGTTALAMHELALADAVVQQIAERLGDARVVRVRLVVGRLAAVVPDAMRFAFEVCARGTTLEGAALEVREVEGRGRCRTCGAEVVMSDMIALCPCGSADVDLRSGGELRIEEVEVV